MSSTSEALDIFYFVLVGGTCELLIQPTSQRTLMQFEKSKSAACLEQNAEQFEFSARAWVRVRLRPIDCKLIDSSDRQQSTGSGQALPPVVVSTPERRATPARRQQSSQSVRSASRQAGRRENAPPPASVPTAGAQQAALPVPYVGGQVARGLQVGLLGNKDYMETPSVSRATPSRRFAISRPPAAPRCSPIRILRCAPRSAAATAMTR